eukprot:Gb_33888 [translate_table: standard]
MQMHKSMLQDTPPKACPSSMKHAGVEIRSKKHMSQPWALKERKKGGHEMGWLNAIHATDSGNVHHTQHIGTKMHPSLQNLIKDIASLSSLPSIGGIIVPERRQCHHPMKDDALQRGLSNLSFFF